MKRAPKIGWSGGPGGTKFEVEVRTVYELLDVIRQKPGIYVGVPSVTALFHYIRGFREALATTGNPFDAEVPRFSGFDDWIAARLGFAESTLGWKDMLLRAAGDESAAFDRFFLELDQYRRTAER